ncbi:hypothetical protein [Caldicellulosiruptor acetigenus]|uniref:hypothetical protein n=1 Tax=Caldicellulosiruptor acetigenus TaxID=301953 RepID=UPI0004049857|nr:hypothetical protein [Caldicellulosiruptor acetigenus]WAM36990.1 hypothetical protein OTK01_000805 [Caldicellulosiruptor acetigenus]
MADKIRKALNEIEQGFDVDSSKITLSEWLKIWLWTYKRNQIKISTFESYETIN